MDDRAAKNVVYARELRKLKPDVREAASEALMQILEGVSRFCIEHGFGKSEVEAALRRALVSQGLENCKLQGREPNVSRLAIITGITRKQVRQIRLENARNVGPSDLPAGKLVRLVDSWQTDPAFLDEKGNPRHLSCSGTGHGEFGELARDAAGDIPPTALLRELARMGAVRRNDDHVELVSHELLAKLENDDDGLLAIKVAGDAVSDFFATLNNNLTPDTKPLLERRVVADTLSEEDREDFKIFAEHRAREFLESLNQWLLDKRRTSGANKSETEEENRESGRVGVGVYLFLDPKSSGTRE